jgi:uncharacterized protein (UPF0212 family)
MNTKRLALLPFDLAYLVLLTENGTKPLSRWEGMAQVGIEDALKAAGLKFATVCRSLRNGKFTTELVFGKSEAYLDLYFRRFNGSLIEKSLEAQRIEGYLFGFPSCCVESFARYGYRPNGLVAEDQRLLFHCACPACRVTPLLLPSYRSAYRQCTEILAKGTRPHGLNSLRRKRITNKAILALSVAGLMAAGGATYSLHSSYAGASVADDPHWLAWPTGMDNDLDFLVDEDEPYLGVDPNNPDSDGNGVLDGVQLAQAAYQIFAVLPHEVQSDRPYVVDYIALGLEQCSVCGASINMGYAEIVNPLENLTIEIPYIGLHFLEHGSLQYSGNVHTSGQVHLRTLNAVLNGDGTWHRLSWGNDSDNDGLCDSDEPYLGTDPGKTDSDMNGVIDGTQLSRAFAAVVDTLPRNPQTNAPYAEDHMLRGIVTCPKCGEVLNMGYVRVINPLENQSIDLPYISLHYMRCAGFVYGYDSTKAMIDPRVLQAVLTSDGTLHRLPIEGDTDSDGLIDIVESRFSCQTGNPDTDGDGVADGVQLARQYWGEIEALPQQVSSVPYRLDRLVYGIETCEMCGEEVNMGYLEIVNPAENFRTEVPYLSLHYLQHGSFRAHGDVHNWEQIDPRILDCALHGDGSMHLLPLADDSDHDGLTSPEEAHFGTQPNVPDTDNNGLLDGVDIGRELFARIDNLPRTVQPDRPYRIDIEADGMEACEICGELVNMGFVTIVNPLLGDSLVVPYIGLHAMKHAGFAYEGTVHTGRVDPVHLGTLLAAGPESVESTPGVTPTKVVLWPCYPNPFNSSTTIRYFLPRKSNVQLTVFNTLGQQVAQLVNAKGEEGYHETRFDGTNLPSGIYVYRLQAEGFVQSRKLVLLR